LVDPAVGCTPIGRYMWAEAVAGEEHRGRGFAAEDYRGPMAKSFSGAHWCAVLPAQPAPARGAKRWVNAYAWTKHPNRPAFARGLRAHTSPSSGRQHVAETTFALLNWRTPADPGATAPSPAALQAQTPIPGDWGVGQADCQAIAGCRVLDVRSRLQRTPFNGTARRLRSGVKGHFRQAAVSPTSVIDHKHAYRAGAGVAFS
jgi:hypothetical protein